MAPTDVIEDVVTTLEELVELVREPEFIPGQKYLAARDRYCTHEDGGATQRVLDMLLNDSPSERLKEDPRKTLVFFSSLIPNGIFTALLGLIRALDRTRYRIVIVCDARSAGSDAWRQASLKQLPEDVEIIGRIGETIATPEERWLMSRFDLQSGEVSEAARDHVRRAYRRELRRVLGPWCREAVFIEFEGYSPFWGSFFGFGRPEGSRGIIFLHNQMFEERKNRFPYLATTMSLYREFDALAAVSDATRKINETDLRSEFGDKGLTVQTVHNVVDDDFILLSEDDEADHWNHVAVSSPRLIMIGRLSSEKNHQLMISAMPAIIETYPDARLLILGSGPLETELKAQVAGLNLRKHVGFTGQVENPMATLKRADLFVMSSTHEGLPMVLLEAMSLGIPIITTPVPGCVEASDLGGGTVVESDIDSFTRGVLEALKAPKLPHFDREEFNKTALSEFDSVVNQRSVPDIRTTIESPVEL